MRAVLVTKYGGPEVLQVKEVPTPSPKENEVLIKIHAAAVNNTDPVFRKGKPFVSRFFTGLSKPKYSIPGDVLSGEIVEIGNSVTKFKTGARVYGYSSDTSGTTINIQFQSSDSVIEYLGRYTHPIDIWKKLSCRNLFAKSTKEG